MKKKKIKSKPMKEVILEVMTITENCRDSKKAIILLKTEVEYKVSI